jgi:hypothetical protein
MRSGGTSLLKIGFALCSVTAFSSLSAAESAPAPAPAAAPEKIEFSRSSSAPKVPRPGTGNENRLERFGNIPDRGSQAPDLSPPMAPPSSGVLPSRAATEKFLIEWDKKKNWAVPGEEEDAAANAFAKSDEKKEDGFGEDKPKTRMEQFLVGAEESKRKTPGPTRLRDLDRDNDRRDNRTLTSLDRIDKRDDRKDDGSPRDPNDNSESNGLAEFNLKNFIRQQNGMPTFLKDNPMPRASQLFRPEVNNNAFDARQLERDRTQRDARAAEFNQLIKPRLPGTFAGPSDPINAPDLTRREINPITPRSFDGSSERASFGVPPPSPASRIQDNNMFGVTGPAASSASPAVSAPLPRPDNTRSRQIIIEAPKRIGF